MIVDNFKPFGLIAAPTLCQNANLFSCFRDGELYKVCFSRNIAFDDNTLKQMVGLKSIKDLDFDQVNLMTSKSIDSLNQFPALEKLIISQSGVNFQDLLKLKRLKQLKTLDVRSVKGNADEFLAGLDGSHQMTNLCIRRTELKRPGMEIIARLPALDTLDISGIGKLRDQDLQPLSKMKNLHNLAIEDCPHLTDGCFAYIKHLHLRHLTIDADRFDPAALQELRNALPGCSLDGSEHMRCSIRKFEPDQN